MAGIVLMQDDQGELIKLVPGLSEWEPVNSWAVGDDGKRRPTEEQERNRDGEFLWRRQVLFTVSNFGRSEAALGEVRQWSRTKPVDDAAAALFQAGHGGL